MVDCAIENRLGERPTTAGRRLVLPSDREGIGQWWPPSWGGGTWAPESLKSSREVAMVSCSAVATTLLGNIPKHARKFLGDVL